MLVKEELIARVKDYFNLNIYETKVWLALLSKGISSAGEVASISRVPRSRTYDVLESLEKKGFAIAKIGKPVKYMGVKPKIILEQIKNGVVKSAEERIQKLSNIKETEEFLELEKMYKGDSDPIKKENVSLELKGKSSISGYVREIIQKAEKEVIVCTDAEDMRSKLKTFRQTFEILKNSGIDVIVALSGEDYLITQIEESLGLKVKKTAIQAKFFIIDRKEILFYLSRGDSYEEKEKDEDIAIWINSDFFTEAFTNLFNLNFKSKESNMKIKEDVMNNKFLKNESVKSKSIQNKLVKNKKIKSKAVKNKVVRNKIVKNKSIKNKS